MKIETTVCCCHLMTYNLFFFKAHREDKRKEKKAVSIFILSSHNLNSRPLGFIEVGTDESETKLP